MPKKKVLPLALSAAALIAASGASAAASDRTADALIRQIEAVGKVAVPGETPHKTIIANLKKRGCHVKMIGDQKIGSDDPLEVTFASFERNGAKPDTFNPAASACFRPFTMYWSDYGSPEIELKLDNLDANSAWKALVKKYGKPIAEKAGSRSREGTWTFAAGNKTVELRKEFMDDVVVILPSAIYKNILGERDARRAAAEKAEAERREREAAEEKARLERERAEREAAAAQAAREEEERLAREAAQRKEEAEQARVAEAARTYKGRFMGLITPGETDVRLVKEVIRQKGCMLDGSKLVSATGGACVQLPGDPEIEFQLSEDASSGGSKVFLNYKNPILDLKFWAAAKKAVGFGGWEQLLSKLERDLKPIDPIVVKDQEFQAWGDDTMVVLAATLKFPLGDLGITLDLDIGQIAIFMSRDAYQIMLDKMNAEAAADRAQEEQVQRNLENLF